MESVRASTRQGPQASRSRGPGTSRGAGGTSTSCGSPYGPPDTSPRRLQSSWSHPRDTSPSPPGNSNTPQDQSGPLVSLTPQTSGTDPSLSPTTPSRVRNPPPPPEVPKRFRPSPLERKRLPNPSSLPGHAPTPSYSLTPKSLYRSLFHSSTSKRLPHPRSLYPGTYPSPLSFFLPGKPPPPSSHFPDPE